VDPIAKFDNPPVIETVLGIQFAPLERFTASHVGLYWSGHLDDGWTEIKEAAPLVPQVVKFNRQDMFQAPGFRIEESKPLIRTQVILGNQEQMLQIQEDRFIFNWKKRGRDYPSYDSLRPEFTKHFRAFQSFVQANNLGDIKLDHWEVTYVNRILKGELWNSLDDWESIFPNVFAPYNEVNGQLLEGFNSRWGFRLGKEEGRLTVSLAHVLTKDENDANGDSVEAIDFRLSAQGPIRDLNELDKSFDLGHNAIVSRFVNMTSESAQKRWGRTV